MSLDRHVKRLCLVLFCPDTRIAFWRYNVRIRKVQAKLRVKIDIAPGVCLFRIDYVTPVGHAWRAVIRARLMVTHATVHLIIVPLVGTKVVHYAASAREAPVGHDGLGLGRIGLSDAPNTVILCVFGHIGCCYL